MDDKEKKKTTSTTKKKTNKTTKTTKSTTTKKTGTTAAKKTTTTKKTTTKPVKKEPKKEVYEETLDDIDIVFQTVKEMRPVETITKPVSTPTYETKKVEAPKKKKVKYRLNVKAILTIVLIILVIDVIFAGCIITLSGKKNNKEGNEQQEKKKDNTKEETKKEETTKSSTERDKYDKDKLKKLNDIDKQLDFFKYENLDRYIAYKEKNPSYTNEMVVVYVNIGLDNEFYTNIVNSPNQNNEKVLVNKYYSLSSDYEPSNLISIDEKYSSGNKKMVKEATEAFNSLAKDARDEGYNIRAVSTYRSYIYQKDLYNRYASNDGSVKADTYSARPGHSEHQTGLAVDVDNANLAYTAFGDTKEFTWMQRNAYKYGFILRYTKDNEWITGYNDEPWHYRYVGQEIAKYINEHPMTYEEYFVRFLDN
jgi:LAS superfamily LD-carboxypeptidase LdcB